MAGETTTAERRHSGEFPVSLGAGKRGQYPGWGPTIPTARGHGHLSGSWRSGSLEERGTFNDLSRNGPIGEPHPAKGVIADAESLLVGKSTHAAGYARTILPQVRAEMENVVRTVKEEGRWVGSSAHRVTGTRDGRAVRVLTWLHDGTEPEE